MDKYITEPLLKKNKKLIKFKFNNFSNFNLKLS